MGDQSPQKPPPIAQKRNRQCDENVATSSQSIEIASDDIEIDFIAKKPRDADCVTSNGDGHAIATNGDDVTSNGDDETRQSNEYDDDYDDEEDDDYDDLVSFENPLMIVSVLGEGH